MESRIEKYLIDWNCGVNSQVVLKVELKVARIKTENLSKTFKLIPVPDYCTGTR